MSHCDEFCLRCYANVRGRANYRSHRGYRPPRAFSWGEHMQWVKRASGTGVAGVSGTPPDDPAFSKAYPALWEHASSTTWEDGKSRAPTTMLFYMEEGRWRVCLVDKAQGMVAFLSGATFHELLKTIEKKLEAGEVEWRKQRPYAGKK